MASTRMDTNHTEAARKELCTALYAVLGGLMHLYAKTSKSILPYFDLQTLRKYY